MKTFKFKSAMLSRKALRGFTLIELMVAITLIAIIAGVGTVYFMGILDKGKIDTARTQAYEIAKAVEIYKLQTGEYPSAQDGLHVLVERKIMKDLPKDPWNNDYNYSVPGVKNPDSFDVWSDGPPGGEGGIQADIGNWKAEK